MARRRFYVPRELIGERVAILPSIQAHHLRDVLRLSTGDTVEIFDGSGSGYAGEVELRGNEVLVRGLERIDSPRLPFRLTLAAALIKAAHFELILQKVTELGADEIIPLKTRFSDIRIPEEKLNSRLERWRRIVVEAAKQCRRLTVPTLRPPLNFSAFLSSEELPGCTKILFYEKAAQPLRPGLLMSDRIVLCTGPEGGWDTSEIAQAETAGFGVFSLGSSILRAETAAIAAAAVVQHEIHLLSAT